MSILIQSNQNKLFFINAICNTFVKVSAIANMEINSLCLLYFKRFLAYCNLMMGLYMFLF